MSRKQVAVLIIVVAICIIAARHIHADTLCTPVDGTPVTGTTDTCKEGECAGYPDGICEGNPEHDNGKGQNDYNDTPDPNRPYYDAAGNEYDAAGTLIRPVEVKTAPVDNTPVIVNDAPGTGK